MLSQQGMKLFGRIRRIVGESMCVCVCGGVEVSEAHARPGLSPFPSSFPLSLPPTPTPYSACESVLLLLVAPVPC